MRKITKTTVQPRRRQRHYGKCAVRGCAYCLFSKFHRSIKLWWKGEDEIKSLNNKHE